MVPMGIIIMPSVISYLQRTVDPLRLMVQCFIILLIFLVNVSFI